MTIRQNLEAYVQVPMMFLQAGFPLKLSLFIFTPRDQRVSLFRRKGEILELESLMALLKLPPARLLTQKVELDSAVAYLRMHSSIPLFGKS